MTGDPFARIKRDFIPWASAEFDLLPETRIILSRGMIAVTGPRTQEFLLPGESGATYYSYVVFNEHFSPRRHLVGFLWPTDHLDSLVAGSVVELPDWQGFRADQADICLAPFDPYVTPPPEDTPVLNLGWGSNIGGSLCNAFPPRSAPYHVWERFVPPDASVDHWQHVHKVHSGLRGQNARDSLRQTLLFLKDGHEKVFAVANRYQNLFDLFRVAQALWHKGMTSTGDGPLQASSAVEDLRFNPGTTRMLQAAYHLHYGLHERGARREDFPVLMAAPITSWSQQPSDLLALDTLDLSLRIDGSSVLLPGEGNLPSSEAIDVWMHRVVPHFLTPIDIRFYDRRSLHAGGSTP